MKVDSNLDQESSDGNDKKWAVSECVLKVKTTGFHNRANVKYKKEISKHDFRVFPEPSG